MHKKNATKYSALLLLLLFLAWLIFDLLSEMKGPLKTNAYKLDVSEVSKVDSTLISHNKVYSFKLPNASIKALAGIGDLLYVASAHNLLILKSSKAFTQFEVIKTIKLPETITAICAVSQEEIYVASQNSVYKIVDANHIELLFKLSENAIITALEWMDGQFILADAGNQLAFIYDLEGNMKQKLEDNNNGRPGFIIPSGYFDVTRANSGNFWIVNPGMHVLVQYDKSGNYKADWGNASMGIEGFCGCCNPNHFTFDSADNFFTTEKGLTRIKKYDNQGNFVSVIATPNDFPEETILQGIICPNDTTVIVAEDINNCITVFKQKNK